MRQIHGTRDAKSAVAHDLLQTLVAALPAAIRRQHGIERDRAIMVQAHPIIGENGIRLPRFVAIGGDEHLHTGALQSARQAVEFAQRRLLWIVSRSLSRLHLEGITGGGLRIAAKTRRPHHKHGPGALRFLASVIIERHRAGTILASLGGDAFRASTGRSIGMRWLQDALRVYARTRALWIHQHWP